MDKSGSVVAYVGAYMAYSGKTARELLVDHYFVNNFKSAYENVLMTVNDNGKVMRGCNVYSSFIRDAANIWGMEEHRKEIELRESNARIDNSLSEIERLLGL